MFNWFANESLKFDREASIQWNARKSEKKKQCLSICSNLIAPVRMTFNVPYFVVNPDEYSSEGAHSPERFSDIPCKNWNDWGFGFECNL